ncbi:hypothetical protein MesoLjLc_21080 [Mesorhizobium sp. L-8-10]|uniref:hypothetical protein n=1 Tax=unclassified Mesorhizobium TaxID=325217 RepID=UPI0019276764|nr:MULTISPECIES: hypothetical protein [unclassified Mesorhizobium]BCH22364.1 hypothetical protein MesoLjLb_21490 [Mesorhizobium sp. L-8-3]BCH30178.1 hypothetical protein MesoLjLc_21080 [Mesorhizobium sp. L-8-10]
MKIASLAMLFASLTVAGCAATTPPDVLPAYNPADPAMGIRDTHYHPVVDYVRREPVDPQDWRRQNEQLSPANPGADS